MKETPRKLLAIAVNVFVGYIFWNIGSNPEEAAKIADSVFIPAFIIGIELLLILWTYSNASFVQRVTEGRPGEIEHLGGHEAWKAFIEKVNRETNATLRSQGLEPYSHIFNMMTSSLHPLQSVVWITEVLVAVAFVYAGWFWTGLACLACTVVHWRSFLYMRSRSARLVELAQM